MAAEDRRDRNAQIGGSPQTWLRRHPPETLAAMSKTATGGG
jgi:hypothetical protein